MIRGTKPGVSHVIASLQESFTRQFTACFRGHRGKIADIAIRIPPCQPNKRDIEIAMPDGDTRQLPYYLVGKTEEVKRWIANNIEAASVPFVLAQLDYIKIPAEA